MDKEERINSNLDSAKVIDDRVENDIIEIKHILASEISQLMARENLSKTKTAARLKISRRALERLLDSTKSTITIKTLDHAARNIGKKLHLKLVAD